MGQKVDFGFYFTGNLRPISIPSCPTPQTYKDSTVMFTEYVIT